MPINMLCYYYINLNILFSFEIYQTKRYILSFWVFVILDFITFIPYVKM